MKKKLQVFISSTYLDLIEERQIAVQAVLEAGHIPAGMELFSAGNESQWEVIKNWIDESDILMLILGKRYGSIEPRSSKSYTQLEYEYALKKRKPVFSLIMAGPDYELDENQEVKEKLDKYQRFKELVQRKICKFCSSQEKIEASVIKSIEQLRSQYEFDGWISGKDVRNLQALTEFKHSPVNEPVNLQDYLAKCKKYLKVFLDTTLLSWEPEEKPYIRFGTMDQDSRRCIVLKFDVHNASGQSLPSGNPISMGLLTPHNLPYSYPDTRTSCQPTGQYLHIMKDINPIYPNGQYVCWLFLDASKSRREEPYEFVLRVFSEAGSWDLPFVGEII